MSGLVRLRRALTALVPAVLLTAPVVIAVASLSVPVSAPTVWVSDGTHVAAQIDTDSHAVARTETFPDGVKNLLADPYDRSLWALTATHVMHLSTAGVLLSDTSLATYFVPGATDFKAVLNPYGGNLWVASGNTLLRLNPLGTPDVITQLPHAIRQIALGLDETLYVLTQGELLAFSPNGQITRRQSLAALGFAKEKLDGLAVDTLGDVLWLAGPRVLVRFDLATSALTTVHTAPTPQAQLISPLVLDAFTGTVWIANGSTVFSFDRQGSARPPINLVALNIKMPRSLAFEHQSQTLWVGANGGVVAHFTSTGALLGSLDAGDSGKPVLGVAPAYLLPTVKLQTPASGSVLTQPYTDIHLTLGASCNSRPCDLGDDYLEAFTLNFTLDGVAIPSSSWTITGSDAVYAPGALTEGEIVLDGTATDILNHTSSTLHDSFFIDLPPVITVTSPIDGALTNNPQQTLLGFVNEPVTLTLNGNPLAAPPPTQQFTKTLTLSEGQNTYTLIATDSHGSQTTYSFSLTLDSTPPEAPTAELGELADSQLTVSGTAEAGSTVTVTNLRTNTSQTTTANSDGSYSAQLAAQAGDTIRITVTDAAGNVSEQTETTVPSGLPVINAPPVDRTVVSLLATTTEFLYTGSNPVQTGVAPGTIEPKRAAVLRGKVISRDNTPLGGVTITVHNHPEYGQTLSRADGMFDLAVNGGGVLTLDYQRPGYLPVQRQIRTLWQDFAYADDVVLTPLDSKVTVVDLAASSMQVAQGNTVIDADGTRTATLLFPADTQATMTLPDGSTQSLSALSVRATEYTVGENGPRAMPAPLPPTSGYTYAVELSADEAIAAGATDVRFNQAVPVYVDNFLNFPVGISVPVGYYDRNQEAWISANNGKVLKILSIENGRAQLDTNGDAQVDDATQLSALGITDAEQVKLATLFSVGKTMWRAPVTHFTPWDHNFPFAPPSDATPPKQPEPQVQDKPEDDPCNQSGSIIECQNQTLGERIPIAGTPFTLNYRSDRVLGRKSAALDVSLSGSVVPASLKRIELEIFVAGHKFAQSFPASPNQKYRFEWDGRDIYGRQIQGSQVAVIRIGYVYGSVRYTSPAQFERAFASIGGASINFARSGLEFTSWQEYLKKLRVWDARQDGLGAWKLNAQHIYDPVGKILTFGEGGQRSADNVSPISTKIAGTGNTAREFTLGSGGLAVAAPLHGLEGIAVGSDGSFYFAELNRHVVWKVSPEGVLFRYAGGDNMRGFSGDGGLATAAKLSFPQQIALGPDGSLYIVDSGNHRVRRVWPNGIISTVAGNGTTGFSGDGGPATQAGLSGNPAGIAVANDGSFYIATPNVYRVRRVGPDGIITTVAGNGISGFSGDGGPATQAKLGSFLENLALGPDGSLYIADRGNTRVRRVSPSGIITTIAGNGLFGFTGDGGLATLARLGALYSLVVDQSGAVYVGDSINGTQGHVRRISADGIITTLAGGSGAGATCNGVFAQKAPLKAPQGLAFGPDRSLYIAENRGIAGATFGYVCRVSSLLPDSDVSDLFIPAEDGTEIYQFTAEGRHIKTLNAKTNATIYDFLYSAGLLAGVRDGDGNLTQIERMNGVPVAIVSPNGQRTTFTLDVNGYLASVTNPASETYRMGYTTDGLLTSLTEPRNHSSTMQYDPDGLLTRDENAAGGFWSMVRSGDSNNHVVTMSTAEGRTTQYRTEVLVVGDTRSTITSAAGTTNVVLNKSDGTTQTTAADGTITTQLAGAEPRFGVAAPLSASSVIKTPSGLTSTTTMARTITLSNVLDPLSLASEITTTTVNGRSFVATYTASARQFVLKSPLNRVNTMRTDAQGRPIFSQVADIEATNYGYDSRGRLSTVTQGSGASLRSLTYTYGADGYVDTITDAQNRQTLYQRDAVGRVTRATLPGSRVIGTDYDANGNVTGITPPNKPEHTFDYTAVDLAEQYTPPTVTGVATPTTQYAYNRDKQLELLTRPDGVTLDYGYDTAGRLQTITPSANGDAITYGYHATTGQLTSIATPQHTLAYTYDGFLPKTETLSGTVAGTLSRNYDANFRTTQIGVNGSSITLGYDNDDLLTSAGSLTLGRDSQNGLLTGTTLGSATTANTYNTFGELATFSAKYGASTLLSDTYTYDTLGRIKTKAESVQGATSNYVYGYDLAGRLETVTKNGTPVESYGYDANGNRNGGTYDDQDRLLSYGGNTYTYTANGELDLKTNATGTTNYDYDVYGNLKSVLLPDGTQITYLTDGRNRRIGKQINETTVQGFLYEDQLRIAAELDDSNNVVSRFVYGTKINVPDYMVKAGTTYRIVTDHLGSVRLVVNTATGTIAQRMDYDSYGNVTNDTNPGFQPFGFAGGLYDRDTKLTRFGARDYDAEVGRWTSKDPIGFDGGDTNIYVYASSDPVNLVDPDGRIVPILIGLAAGYAFDYFLENYKEEHCECTGSQGTPLGSAGNTALGGAVGATGPFASKPRGGIAGGGPSGTATSTLSQMNHMAANRGWYSVSTRHTITKWARKVPYVGTAVAAYEIYDAVSCE